jgi:hypothetical protein
MVISFYPASAGFFIFNKKAIYLLNQQYEIDLKTQSIKIQVKLKNINNQLLLKNNYFIVFSSASSMSLM